MDTTTWLKITFDAAREVAAHGTTRKATFDQIEVAKRIVEIVAGYNAIHNAD